MSVMQVLEPGEVYLDGNRFAIKGGVQPILTSVFPAKVVVGDYNKESNNELSSWVLADLRSGILCEEMDEKTQFDRSWFANTNCQFKNHHTLQAKVNSISFPAFPSGATLVNPSFDNGTSGTDGWTVTGSDGTLNKYLLSGDDYYVNVSCSNLYNPSYYNRTFTQTITLSESVTNMVVKFKAKALATYQSGGTGSVTIKINSTTVYTGIGNWADYVGGSIRVSGSSFTVSIQLSGTAAVAESASGKANDAILEIGYSHSAPLQYRNFNGDLYIANGSVLYKLDKTTGNSLIVVRTFGHQITSLCDSVGTCLYVALGDDDYYEYMNTSGTWTVTNQAGATWFAHWQDKLFALSQTGALIYSTTPNSAAPVFLGNGTLHQGASTINNLDIYRSAEGNPILYVATTSGLFAHDFANDRFVETELALPEHPNAGKGVCWWRDSYYVTAGLDVLRYIAGGTATIQSCGLDRDDGLPAEYRGEIVSLIKGYNEFYALVDASQTDGTGYSGVYAKDEWGWHPVWLASTADKVMSGGIISSAYDYRLYFDHDGTLYYLTRERNIRNPLQSPSYSFTNSGVLITPWYDGDWQVGQKLAVRYTVACKCPTSSETITVKYRLDHAYTDTSTGWTTLGVISSSGETTFEFANSAGITFKAIQFRFDFARGTTDTLSPDLEYTVLSYLKLIPDSWGWRIQIDCSKPYKEKTPEQQIDLIRSLCSPGTLKDFCFRADKTNSDTFKVRIRSAQGLENTGKEESGQFVLLLTAP